MKAPPPLPGSEFSAEALATFRAEAAHLGVEDVLALCFAFSQDPRRMRAYLEVMRSKPGVKAQAAACLICYDLARGGDKRFEGEFMALVPVMLGWLPGEPGAGVVDRLVAGDEYLAGLWTELQGRLRAMDPRSAGEVVEITDADTVAVEIDLLDEADLGELAADLDILEVDDAVMRAQWHQALERFCVFNLGMQQLPDDAPAGFVAGTRKDLDRVERLVKDAESLARDVADARTMLPLAELFLGTHTRARTLLGGRNKTRDAHVVKGLTGLLTLDRAPEHAVGWLLDPTAAPFAWEKVAETVLDYLGFWARLPADQRALPIESHVQRYVDTSPQPAPARLAADPRERRRR